MSVERGSGGGGGNLTDCVLRNGTGDKLVDKIFEDLKG